MDGQTSPFHLTTCNRQHQHTAKMQGLWFLFMPLWCVSGTCARLLSQTGELLLLPSLHITVNLHENSQLFVRAARHRKHTNWQISHHILSSNWCQSSPNWPCCTRQREAQKRNTRVHEIVTSLSCQRPSARVQAASYRSTFVSGINDGWDENDEPFPASADVLEILLGFGILIWSYVVFFSVNVGIHAHLVLCEGILLLDEKDLENEIWAGASRLVLLVMEVNLFWTSECVIEDITVMKRRWCSTPKTCHWQQRLKLLSVLTTCLCERLKAAAGWKGIWAGCSRPWVALGSTHQLLHHQICNYLRTEGSKST